MSSPTRSSRSRQGAVGRLRRGSQVRFSVAAVTLLGTVAGCGTLPVIGENICGNGVLEPGEACDGPQPTGRACAADCLAFTCGASNGENATTANATCPEGLACGIDDTCFGAVGVLLPVATTVRGSADRFTTLGIQSNRPRSLIAQTADVFGRGRPRFLGFEPDATLRDDTTVLTSLGALGTLRLDNDKTEKLFGTVPGGTVVITAPGDGTIFSESFSTFASLPGPTRVALVRRPSEAYDDGMLLTTERGADGSEQIAGLAQDGRSSAPVLRFPGNAGDLLRVASVHDLDTESVTGCSPLLLALRGQVDVLRASVCERSADGVRLRTSDEANGILAENAKPMLRQPFPLQDGPFVALVDEDDFPDVVGVVQVPNDGSTAPDEEDLQGRAFTVGFGGPDGWGTAPPGSPDRTLGEAIVVGVVARRLSNERGSLGRPLVVGDFTNSPSPSEALDATSPWTTATSTGDAVGPHGLLVAFERAVGVARFARPTATGGKQTPALSFSISYLRSSSWTTAAIGSVNGDTIPDVVGGSRNDTDLDVLRGSGGLLFSVATIATGTTTEALALGDFDGDLVNDIAFSSSLLDAQGATDSTLSVVYGRRTATPDPVVLVARYPNTTIEQVAAAELAIPGTAVDITAELAVVTSDGNGGNNAVSVLRGDGNRLPISPLSLSAAGGIAGDTLATVAVRTSSADDSTRFVMIGDSGPEGIFLWRETSTAGATERGTRLPDCATEVDATAPASDTSLRLRRASGVAVDLDGDAIDEVVAAVTCQNGKFLYLFALDGDTWTVRAGGASWPIVSPAAATGGDDPNDGAAEVGAITLSRGDIDQDGFVDVLAQLDGTGPSRRADVRTLAYFGNGTSGIDALPGAAPTELRVDDAPVVSTTFLARSSLTGAPKTFVVATREGAFLSANEPGSRAFAYTRLAVGSAASSSGDRIDIRTLHGADVTGDTVDDLIVADSSGIHLYPGASHR
jgi:hypothetical protein